MRVVVPVTVGISTLMSLSKDRPERQNSVSVSGEGVRTSVFRSDHYSKRTNFEPLPKSKRTPMSGLTNYTKYT